MPYTAFTGDNSVQGLNTASDHTDQAHMKVTTILIKTVIKTVIKYQQQ